MRGARGTRPPGGLTGAPARPWKRVGSALPRTPPGQRAVHMILGSTDSRACWRSWPGAPAHLWRRVGCALHRTHPGQRTVQHDPGVHGYSGLLAVLAGGHRHTHGGESVPLSPGLPPARVLFNMIPGSTNTRAWWRSWPGGPACPLRRAPSFAEPSLRHGRRSPARPWRRVRPALPRLPPASMTCKSRG